jgi:hypothetical protein
VEPSGEQAADQRREGLQDPNTPFGLCVAGLIAFMCAAPAAKMCPQPPTLVGM